MNKIVLLLLAFSLFPILSFADDQAYKDDQMHKDGQTHHWKGVSVVGASFSGKTNYTVNESNGSSLGTTSDKANAFVDFAGEITYQSAFPLGGSLFIEGTRYSNETGGTDGELGFYLMPRLAHSFGPVEFWGGVGLGMMLNLLGGPNAETQNGVTLTLTNMNPVSFAWTPRVGIDVDLTSRLFVGAQFSYTQTAFSVPYSASEVASITGTIDATRSWLDAALRIGSRF